MSSVAGQKTVFRKPPFRSGLALWLAGMVGVFSVLLMPLPLPEGIVLPMPVWLAKLLGLIQPTVLLTLAVWAGVKLAPKVSLHAPAFEAFGLHQSILASLRPQILPGAVVGVIGGVGLIGLSFLTPAALAGAQAMFDPPLATRLLYGGVTEEILVRWGLMTFLLWAAWRLFGQGTEQPAAVFVWCSIVLSAIVFGALHLPLAFALVEEVTGGLLLYVIGGNTIFGVLFGYLYWRRGLEASMIAHALAHLVAFLVTLTPYVS